MSYLDLQHVISTDTLVVHLMVRIICIAAAFIFHEGKPTYCVNGGRVVVTSVRMPMIGRLTVD